MGDAERLERGLSRVVGLPWSWYAGCNDATGEKNGSSKKTFDVGVCRWRLSVVCDMVGVGGERRRKVMLRKTVGWWVAMVAALSATTGCNAILGWEQSWDAGPAPSCEGAGTDGCTGQVNDCCDSLVVAGLEGSGSCNRLAGFRLDAYEVTVGRFKAFLDAPDGYSVAKPPNGWLPTLEWKSDENALRKALGDCDSTMNKGDTLPMNCITWAEAFAFCQWDRGRLPTTGEFQRAAQFPWRDAGIDETRAVFGKLEVSLVGQKPAGVSAFGQLDLVGNVQEWTKLLNSKECPGASDFNMTGQPCFGGSFTASENDFFGKIPEVAVAPDSRQKETGFRCAREP